MTFNKNISVVMLSSIIIMFTIPDSNSCCEWGRKIKREVSEKRGYVTVNPEYVLGIQRENSILENYNNELGGGLENLKVQFKKLCEVNKIFYEVNNDVPKVKNELIKKKKVPVQEKDLMRIQVRNFELKALNRELRDKIGDFESQLIRLMYEVDEAQKKDQLEE